MEQTTVKDFITDQINTNYIWSGLYLEHLVKTIKVIAAHGRAVIVGRGADFILRPDIRFSVRTVAPMNIRIQNVSSAYGVSETEAKKRIQKRESRRRRFIKEAFGGDVENPIHYDMILNTGRLSIEAAAESIVKAAKMNPIRHK